MNDIIKHIKNQIEKVTTDALKAVNPDVTTEIEIEIPKEKSHGDFSVNTAMKLTKILLHLVRLLLIIQYLRFLFVLK